MSLRSEPPCCEIHCCEAPNVMRVKRKTYRDSTNAPLKELTNPRSILVLTHPLPDRDADVTHAPSNEEVCTVGASLAQCARAVHTWKSGHLFLRPLRI